MSTPAPTARHHEAGSNVEDLLRYAMSVRYSSPVSHSQMVRVIRKAFRFGGAGFARTAIDRYLDRASWENFELYVNGYADPTGAQAAQNLDNQARLAAMGGAQ